jgi:fructose-1,6-bisphosphatase I
VLNDQINLGTQATGDLTLLLTAIQTTSKFIATNVRKARLINLYASIFDFGKKYYGKC